MKRLSDGLRLVIGLVVACSLQTTFAHEGHQPLPTKGVQVDLTNGHLTLSRNARQILDVQTVEVDRGTVESSIRAYSTVVAPWTRHAYVTTRLPGRIAVLHVRPGEVVRAGQVIAEIDSLDLHRLRLDYQEAINQLALTTKLLESLRPIANTDAIPRQRLVETETAHRQHENTRTVLESKARLLGVTVASLSSSETDDSPVRLPVISPIAGLVVHADISVGKFVEPNEHLFEIVDASRVWVKVGVLEQDLSRVGIEYQTRLTVAGRPGEVFEGKIDRISQLIDPKTHQGTAWMEFANSETASRLVPGMSGVAEVISPGESSRMTVPSASLFSDGAERFLLVEATSTKESSEYRKVPVVIGRRTRDQVEIASGGVFPGDRVVTRGGHELATLFFSGVLRISPETARGIGLRVEDVKQQTVETVLEVDGLVDVPPAQRSFASTQLSGTIRSIHVDRGQRVNAGELLAEITSLEFHDLQLDLLRTHLDAQLWRETLARLEKASDAIARRQIVETTSRLSSLDVRIQSLKDRLRILGLDAPTVTRILETRELVEALPVRAPIDGALVDFDRILGQIVQANEPLFEIHDSSQAWVQVFVTEPEAAQVRTLQTARIRLVAAPDTVVEGRVTRISPVVETQNRLQSLWIEFNRPSGMNLQHNMLARVTLTIARPSPSLAVPRGSVIRDGLRSFVFAQKSDGSFERRQVEIGLADDRYLMVTRGLSESERIATQGTAQLQAAYSALR